MKTKDEWELKSLGIAIDVALLLAIFRATESTLTFMLTATLYFLLAYLLVPGLWGLREKEKAR